MGIATRTVPLHYLSALRRDAADLCIGSRRLRRQAVGVCAASREMRAAATRASERRHAAGAYVPQNVR